MTTGTIYSIGHSTLPLLKFLANLQRHHIGILVDVRSIPKSRWFPQYNQAALEKALTERGVKYVWQGQHLGGKRQNIDFAGGIAWLAALIKLSKKRVAMLCSEGDFRFCHRHTHIEPALKAYGIRTIHILRTGGLRLPKIR